MPVVFFIQRKTGTAKAVPVPMRSQMGAYFCAMAASSPRANWSGQEVPLPPQLMPFRRAMASSAFIQFGKLPLRFPQFFGQILQILLNKSFDTTVCFTKISCLRYNIRLQLALLLTLRYCAKCVVVEALALIHQCFRFSHANPINRSA